MDRKYYTTNSSGVIFEMPQVAVKKIKETEPNQRPVITYERVRRAIEFRPDGVELNVYAPDAKSIEIAGTHMSLWGEKKRSLSSIGDGWWRGVMTDIPAGIQFVDYFKDGKRFLYDQAPVCFAHSVLCNFIEVPDPNIDFYDFMDVPHGAVRLEYYESSWTRGLRNCWVYTPPTYDTKNEKRYPVLYVQHGGGECESGWIWQGKINFIMDNLIAAGQCEEMIVVSNMGQAAGYDFKESEVLPGDLGRLLIDDCIPFIEKRFRAIPEKRFRALCGLSMGAYQTQDIGYNNPDVFDYLGVFSGFHGGVISKKFEKFFTEENAEKFNSQHKLLYFSCGMQEGGESLIHEAKRLRALGINIEYFTCDGVHEWQTWRKAAHDFAQKIFKD